MGRYPGFSDRLNALVERSGRPASRIAEDLGISKQALSTWRTGAREPKPPTMDALSRYFGVSARWLCGDAGAEASHGELPLGALRRVPILGTVRAGYDDIAQQEYDGYDLADVSHPEDYFFLRVTGDSMSPQIHPGELALVRKQQDVESGDVAVVLIEGDEATLKRVIKKRNSLVLQPFNPAYEARLFVGEEMNQVRILGRVMETKRKW